MRKNSKKCLSFRWKNDSKTIHLRAKQLLNYFLCRLLTDWFDQFRFRFDFKEIQSCCQSTVSSKWSKWTYWSGQCVQTIHKKFNNLIIYRNDKWINGYLNWLIWLTVSDNVLLQVLNRQETEWCVLLCLPWTRSAPVRVRSPSTWIIQTAPERKYEPNPPLPFSYLLHFRLQCFLSC